VEKEEMSILSLIDKVRSTESEQWKSNWQNWKAIFLIVLQSLTHLLAGRIAKKLL